jgi:DNA-directed RNA polymerase beta' subunit
MGHIELVRPVVHPWFVGKSGLLADLLDMDRDSLQRLIHYDASRVIHPGRTAFRVGQLLHPDEHAEAARVDEQFTAETGAEAVRSLLRQSRRPELVTLVLDCLPVLPAGLRPDVSCEEPRERVISHTLTLQYQRVVKINNRLRWYIDHCTPEAILREQSRALQRAVELLFGTPRRSASSQRRLSRPARNLSEEFRDAACALLDKTTDFSARGVVVPDPAVPVGSIGVPRLLAVTLFAPLLAAALHRTAIVTSLEESQRLIEEDPSSPDRDRALAAALASRPLLVITERAQIAALQMVVTLGETLRVHPAEGRRLGLSYAGEQVDLHLPLTTAAVHELCRPQPVAETASTLVGLTPGRLLDAMMKGESLELTLLDQMALGLAGFLDGQPLSGTPC